MTKRWTKVDAAHSVEGTREEWRLDVDGRTHAAARVWRSGDRWIYEAHSIDGECVACGLRTNLVKALQAAESLVTK